MSITPGDSIAFDYDAISFANQGKLLQEKAIKIQEKLVMIISELVPHQ